MTPILSRVKEKHKKLMYSWLLAVLDPRQEGVQQLHRAFISVVCRVSLLFASCLFVVPLYHSGGGR